MRFKVIDFGMAILLPILAAALTVYARTSLLLSLLMFFGAPSAYLTIRNPRILKKSAAFALVLSFPLSLFVDTLAAINLSWIIPKSVFPFRLFGLATFEVYLFSLFWVLYVILFYEHFFGSGKSSDRLSFRIRYLIGLAAGLVLYFVWGFFFDPPILHVPYFYALIGIVLLLIPLLLFLFRFPIFQWRFFLEGLYFFFTLCLFEFGALMTSQWIFPGSEYIAWITVMGQHMPIEELVFWICLATPALLAYYEYFADGLR